MRSQQQHEQTKRSYSNYKPKYASIRSPYEPKKKLILMAKLLKKIIQSKIIVNFKHIHQYSESQIYLSQKMASLVKIGTKIALKKGLKSIKYACTQNIKKVCGVKILMKSFRKSLKERKKYGFYKLNVKFGDRRFDKFYLFAFRTINNLMMKKTKQDKINSFRKINQSAIFKLKLIKMVEKVVSKINLRNKRNSFLKIYSRNTNSKIHQSNQQQYPMQEYQENIKLVQGMDEDKSSHYNILKKSPSDANLHNITSRLRDNLNEKKKRSLSRKSRVSSLVDQDFTLILAGSFTSQDYRCYQNKIDQQKPQYYKNLSKTYKNQLELVKKELDALKQLNQNFSVEIQEMIESKQVREIERLKQKLKQLERDKEKYKQRSRKFGVKIIEMNTEFKRKMEALQQKIKKQF